MKLLKLSVTLALLGALTLGMAEDTIDEQIAAIQSASDEDRVELMNEFKENLSTLSEEERTEAITQLRSNVDGDGEQIQTHTQKAEELTQNNTGLTLVIAANYGGQWDIVQATKKIAALVSENQITMEAINSELITRHLTLSKLPYPDLFIRTSGEKRISNFFLWQLAYTEMYFTDILWPDFDEKAFEGALKSYAQRQRRFGKLDDNIEL